jgi:DNA polymerase-3 subunit gamma/tau
MFATTDPEKVLPTILSRCQRFDLRRIPTALITKHLAEIAKKENVKIDEAALLAIARGADGGMRDAESTLDQLISFCGDKIEEADVLSMFGLAAQSQILGLSQAILAGEIQTALTLLNELAQRPWTPAHRFAQSFPQPAAVPGFARRFEPARSFRGRNRRVE